MTGRIGKPCREMMCPGLATEGHYCEKHKDKEPKPFERKAKKDPFYDSSAWRKARHYKLLRHPICEQCGQAAATTVHHLQKLKDRPDLALDLDNLESLCFRCHNRETGREVGKERKGEGNGLYDR